MSIVVEQIVKSFDGHRVVNQVSLEVGDGELFVLLGPSGSGKSTVLRMIAGLTAIDAGRIVLHGKDVTGQSPQRRGIGFVFQHYALFRHMTVADNIEFALKIRRVAADEIRHRRDELLDLVGLVGLQARMPYQLSGGQQQRVALARALAHRPQLLLLDEPFGALDARIRAELRRVLRGIQRELGVTTIFVTHDQEEAFELADRLGVMNFGRLLEVGPPTELYLRPKTEFVATFLGRANLMIGQCTSAGVRLGPVSFPLKTQVAGGQDPRSVQVLFRPEDVAVKTSAEALGWPLLGEGIVEEVDFSGAFERLRLRLPRLAGVSPIAPSAPYGADYVLVEAGRSQHQARRFPLKYGDRAWVGVRRVHALTHPGLGFLLLTDGSPRAQAALEWGAQVARLAHARVTVLGHGSEHGQLADHLQQAREHIGSGVASLDLRSSPDGLAEAVALEAERQRIDLVIRDLVPEDAAETTEQILRSGQHHLLMVPAVQAVPRRALICVAVGEPAKGDVLFAARLLHQLGAEATLLTAIPERDSDWALAQGEKFLAAGARTLSLLGVPAHTTVRRGQALQVIREEIDGGQYDLLLIGAPLAGADGRIAIGGIVGDLLSGVPRLPVLIVRSGVEVR